MFSNDVPKVLTESICTFILNFKCNVRLCSRCVVPNTGEKKTFFLYEVR